MAGIEQDAAVELLQLLGYLPLAIQNAGAYISVQRQPSAQPLLQALRGYLDAFKRNYKGILQWKPSRSMGTKYNHTVFTTWEVSFSALKKEAPNAAKLFLLCGFLAKSDLFEDMLRYYRKLPDKGKHNPQFKDGYCSDADLMLWQMCP